MKNLMLFLLPVLLLFSCEKDPIETIKGDYNLVSYTKVNCENSVADLNWRDVNTTNDQLTVTGTLDIKILSIFKQQLTFFDENSGEEVKKKFVGAFSQTGQEWMAEYSGSPFSGSHCEVADVRVDGTSLIWSFTEEGCQVVMVWEKQ